jgi:hypothetical protein
MKRAPVTEERIGSAFSFFSKMIGARFDPARSGADISEHDERAAVRHA